MYLFWSRKPNVAAGPTETEVLAVVRAVLEDAECQFASDIQKPDSFVRSRPAVDQVFRLGGIQVAMEHTRILAYKRELAQSHLWETQLEPDLAEMELQLSSELPAKCDYELWIDVASRVRRKDWPRLLAHLVGWTRTTIHDLIGFDGLRVRKHEIEIGKSFLWVRVGVYPRGFCSQRSHLRFHVERVSRFSEQAMRELLVGQAFGKKMGKLGQWKAAGARTCLVLEWMSELATPACPTAAVRQLLRGSYPEIDEAITVYTCEKPWAVIRCSRRDNGHVQELRRYVSAETKPIVRANPRELLT